MIFGFCLGMVCVVILGILIFAGAGEAIILFELAVLGLIGFLGLMALHDLGKRR